MYTWLVLIRAFVIIYCCHFSIAWVLLPPKYHYGSRCIRSIPWASTSYSKERIQYLSSSSSTVDNVQAHETQSDPILRTLYNPPPRIDVGNISYPADSQFVTIVYNGTLPTEEGFPHLLYYEVHHRVAVDDIAIGKEGSLANITGTRKKRGLTALVLHGGPGAGCFPRHVNFFSPELYEYVVLLDQRGCGKSTPLGETSMNTLPLLVQDVERLRCHLLKGETPWDCMLGGSWGCTLALAYAHSFPSRVRSMVLRGVCLFRPQEIDWLFGDPPLGDASRSRTSNLRGLVEGKRAKDIDKSRINHGRASQVFSDGWKEFCKGVNLSNTALDEKSAGQSHRNALKQYYHRLLGSNPLIRARAAQSWFRWEMGIYSSGFSDPKVKSYGTNKELLVWNPTLQSWHYEKAMVCNNQSVVSADDCSAVDGSESVVQSLRRYSEPPEEHTLIKRDRMPANSAPQPFQVVDIIETNEAASDKQPTSQRGTSNSTFDPSAFIPAQTMLTCYYSTNDAYVTHPYREFLSLALESAYTSRLPPPPPPIGWKEDKPESFTCKTDTSHPLPPCIAIQGGLDAICPPDTALDLHHVWKELELRIALGSGHSMYDPVIAGEIVKALDRFGNAIIREDKGDNFSYR